ncbi:XRE family transcriptional regulator [Streptomyces sp. DH8]|uniref:XRE family transcriptional regulator n=1 Tax=Streptomyces sp. DH8 TaxID=2857008 RepID=UPI001E3FC4B0|nr:XRE family transcriptional regulator [Streptomyces sp. DH8]
METAPDPRWDLSDLVNRRKGETGLSFRKIAEATIDPVDPEAGPLWTRGTLENLAKREPVKAPPAAMLRALAAGLQVPLRLVQEAAAAQWFGVETVYGEGVDPDTRLLVRRYQQMSPEDRRRLQILAETYDPS